MACVPAGEEFVYNELDDELCLGDDECWEAVDYVKSISVCVVYSNYYYILIFVD